MPPAAPLPAERERILILDFGSQFTQLIARRIREQNVYCEIQPADVGLEAVRAFDPLGIVLSGGPASVLDPGATDLDLRLLDLGRPCRHLLRHQKLVHGSAGGRKSEDRDTAARPSSSSARTPLRGPPGGRVSG